MKKPFPKEWQDRTVYLHAYAERYTAGKDEAVEVGFISAFPVHGTAPAIHPASHTKPLVYITPAWMNDEEYRGRLERQIADAYAALHRFGHCRYMVHAYLTEEMVTLPGVPGRFIFGLEGTLEWRDDESGIGERSEFIDLGEYFDIPGM